MAMSMGPVAPSSDSGSSTGSLSCIHSKYTAVEGEVSHVWEYLPAAHRHKMNKIGTKMNNVGTTAPWDD